MSTNRRARGTSKKKTQTEAKRGSIYGLRKKTIGKTGASKTRSPDIVPLKERLKYILNNTSTDDEGLNPDLLYYLKKTTWCLNKLSPLINIDFREASLKTYAARIKQALARHIQDIENNLTFTTKIILIDSTANENVNYKTLQIEVTQKKGDNDSRASYKGVLLNWSSCNENNGNNLPLLLCNGQVKVRQIVHSTLQQLFNTAITPLEILEDDIYWLCVLAGFYTRMKDKRVELHYHQAGLRDTIKLQVPTQYLEKLWKRIHQEDSNVTTIEEIESFKTTLTEELYECYNIRTNKLCLHKVSLPVITFHSVGKIKFYDDQQIEKLLNFFQDMADIHAPLQIS